MPNPYKNKVVYGNEVIIDITDTTATQSDVARGKYFYLASGEKVEGTASGGMVVIETEDSHGGTVVEITGDAVKLQQKNVTPSTSQQTVSPDSGYNGLSQVVVSAIPGEYIIPTGMKSITENGTGIDVRQYATVDVNVSGGVDAPVFTVTWDANWKEILSVTCNKTYSECVSYFDQGISCALTNETNGVEEYSYAAELMSMGSLGDPITYSLFDDHGPLYDIVFNPNGSIEAIFPSAYNKTLNATKNGTYYPSGGVYTSVNVAVPPTVPTLQEKSVTPTEQAQEVVADSGYDGLSSVTVGAISSDYVGSGVARKGSADLTVSGATITAPAGYYENPASASVPSGTAGTPTATKGIVSNHAVTVTPSVTNTAGYISGGTIQGTGVSVSASELASGTLSITQNGSYDVVGKASVNVDVSDIPSNRAILVARIPSGSTVTATKGGVSVTPMMWVSETYPDQDVALFVFAPAQFDSVNPWTITATDGGFTKSKSVLITENKEYEVEIIFRFYFVKDGQLVPRRLVGRTYAVITQKQDYLRFASNGNTVALTTSEETINLSEYSNLVLKLTSDGTRNGQSWYTSSNVPVLGVSTILPTVSGDAVYNVTRKIFLRTSTGVITGADFSVNVSDRTDSMYIVLTVSGSSSLSGTSGYMNILDLYLE